MSATVAELIDQALAAYDTLEELGESVEDEWSYVTDIHAAWRATLTETALAIGRQTVTDRQVAAVERIVDEVGRIGDPHRAIDWLSTFPQAILLAVGDERG